MLLFFASCASSKYNYNGLLYIGTDVDKFKEVVKNNPPSHQEVLICRKNIFNAEMAVYRLPLKDVLQKDQVYSSIYLGELYKERINFKNKFLASSDPKLIDEVNNLLVFTSKFSSKQIITIKDSPSSGAKYLFHFKK